MDGQNFESKPRLAMPSGSAMPSSHKKHLLVYAHYYELASTGQLVRELAEGLLPQFKVTVICVVPSYLGTVEDKYKMQRLYFENINGVDIIRVRVPEFSKTNKLSRIKNIAAYFLGAVKATGKVENVDCVMAVSQPPILGGMLGTYGKKKCHVKDNRTLQYMHKKSAYANGENGIESVGSQECRYIYWVQDCNPEQIRAVGYFRFKLLLWLLGKLDTDSCSEADLVIVPGRDMVETIKKRFAKHPGKMPRVTVINNWIDEQGIHPLETGHPGVVAFKKKYSLEGKYIISYSGNLGNYYGLPELLRVIEKFKGAKTQFNKVRADGNKACLDGEKAADGRDVIFTFIGEGAQKANMEAYVREHHMDNVVFIPYQDKEDLIYSLNAADVHWCVNAKGIKGVSCPSKYYGIAAVGKPVLGVLEKGSEVRCLIEETDGGLVAEPGDYAGIERNIRWFIEHDVGIKNSNEDVDAEGRDAVREMGVRGRKYLEERLTQERSIGKFREVLMR